VQAVGCDNLLGDICHRRSNNGVIAEVGVDLTVKVNDEDIE
jgi:hypothetical protein